MADQLQSIVYARGSLQLLDQTRLPHERVYVAITSCEAGRAAIASMVVRGAPAIAIAAGLSLAVELAGSRGSPQGADETLALVSQRLDLLCTARPTAVNLAELAGRLRSVASAASAAPGAGGASVAEAVIAAAEAEMARDVAANRLLGAHGVAALDALGLGGRPSLRVLTHCNTGSLATAGYGTALGVVRALAAAGRLGGVAATETRPYLQGSRLTAFELAADGLGGVTTLVCDGAAAALMALPGRVDAVLVGADRVAANGDTANKVGTYALAVAARHHRLPFLVCAPTSTLDAATPHGGLVVVEQRPGEEVTHFRGSRVAAAGVGVWNPGFDVTPAALISAIVTERGVLLPGSPGGSFDVAAHLAGSAGAAGGGGGGGSGGAAAAAGGGAQPGAPPPAGAAHMDSASALAYVAARPALAALLGGDPRTEWTCAEVGDGNINFVFLLRGPGGGVALKHAPPFVRMVGPSWPLAPARLGHEAAALARHHAACPRHAPRPLLYDAAAGALAMTLVDCPPHALLRSLLTGGADGAQLPGLASHLASFLAATLWAGSALAQRGAAFRALCAASANPAMCALTDQVVFSDPYDRAAPHNRHTPGLEAEAAALRARPDALAAAALLKARFLGAAQALLHGDLHTGSVLACSGSTVVFDPEFACPGPMGFDVGALLANLLAAYFASAGLEGAPGARGGQRAWLLGCVADVWRGFAAGLTARWADAVADGTAGEVALPSVFAAAGGGGGGGGGVDGVRGRALALVQAAYLADVWRDTLGFAGAELVRRILGVAHLADFEAIGDVGARAAAERRALRLGASLLTAPADFPDVAAVVDAARALYEAP